MAKLPIIGNPQPLTKYYLSTVSAHNKWNVNLRIAERVAERLTISDPKKWGSFKKILKLSAEIASLPSCAKALKNWKKSATKRSTEILILLNFVNWPQIFCEWLYKRFRQPVI